MVIFHNLPFLWLFLHEMKMKARESILKYQEKERISSEEYSRSISKALNLQREEFEIEKEKQQQWLVEDNTRYVRAYIIYAP